MATMTTTEARGRLADLLGRAFYAHERTTITRNGQPVAAIVPLDDLEAMEAMEAFEDAMDLKAAREALQDYKENGGAVRADEFFQRLETEAKEGGRR